MMKRSLLFVFVSVLMISLGSSSVLAQAVMTLEDAIRIGLEHNYNIQIARNSAQVARNNSGKGRAALLPTVTATANAGRIIADVETTFRFSYGTTETDNLSAQVALDWTLFDGFQMFSEKKRYQELANLGREQSRSLIEANVVAINRAYFNLVVEEQLLEVAESALDISRVRLDKAKLRRELGGASSTDLLNAQVSLNSDRSNLLDRELAVVIGRQELNLLLGRDANISLAVSMELAIPKLDQSLSELHQEAESRNSNLMIVRAEEQVASAGLTSSRSRFLPRVSLNGAYSWTDRDLTPDTSITITFESTEKSVGLNLVWNLFNGGKDRIDWQNAKVDLNSRQLALKQIRQQLAGELNAQHETYVRRKELVEIENQNVAAADQNLELLSERYEMGGATSLEFRDAQVNLIRARTGLIIARHQTRLAHLEMQKLTGSLSIN